MGGRRRNAVAADRVNASLAVAVTDDASGGGAGWLANTQTVYSSVAAPGEAVSVRAVRVASVGPSNGTAGGDSGILRGANTVAVCLYVPMACVLLSLATRIVVATCGGPRLVVRRATLLAATAALGLGAVGLLWGAVGVTRRRHPRGSRTAAKAPCAWPSPWSRRWSSSPS